MRVNLCLLYSILNPDTNSDSPSDRSKGVRLISANILKNKIIIEGQNVKINNMNLLNKFK